MGAGTRLPRWVWAAIGTLVAVQVVGPWPYLTPDAVDYLSMARSLARDGTLRRLGDEHVRLGPAYPFVIAPLFRLAAEPFLLLSLLNLALLAAFGAAVFAWARQFAPEAAPYAALLGVGNVVVLTVFRRPLSETVFCGGLFALAVGYNRALAGTLRPGWWALLVPAQCALALTRQAGLFVGVGFAAALVWQASRGRRRWASAIGFGLLATAPPAAAVAGWAAFDGARAHRPGDFHHASALSPGPGPATADMPTGPPDRRLAEGLRVRVAEVGRVTIPLMAKVYAPAETWRHHLTAVYFAWFALVVFGWVRHLRAADDALAWMWPFYFALYVYWPFDQAARFTAPLIPLLVVFLWRALNGFGGWRPILFAALIAAHLLVALGTWAVTDRPRAHALSNHWPQLRRIADEFRDRPGELAVDADAQELTPPLEFLLDRPLSVSRPGDPPRSVVGWADANKGIPLRDRTIIVRRP